MKKIFYLFFFLFSFAFIFWQKNQILSNFNFLFQTPCDSPITYRLGRVDPGYRTSRETFLSQVKKAAEIWNKTAGKKLFAYDPQAQLVVNLIYSERQSVLDRLEQLEGKLKTGQSSLATMTAEYEKLSADFDSRVQKFNQEVAFWIAKGGAPPDEYQRLLEEQKSLNQEVDKLNQMARQLKLKVKNYNLQVGEFNQNVKNYNLAAQAKPEAGLYDGFVPKIDIYLTTSEAELIHTLAHEFGHALGLTHLDDDKSIMHAFSSESVTPTAKEVQIIHSLCDQKNWQILWQEIKENLAEKINHLILTLPKLTVFNFQIRPVIKSVFWV